MNSPNQQKPDPRRSLDAVDVAIAAGVLDAIRENQRYGLPMVSEVDGKIVHVDPMEAEEQLLLNYPQLRSQRPV